MASYVNPFSFLQTAEGTYIFYHDNKPVVDQVVDVTVTRTQYTDSDQQSWISYRYNDQRVYAYMNEYVDSIRSYPQPSTLRLARSDANPTITNSSNDTNANRACDQQKSAADKVQQSQPHEKQIFSTVTQGYGQVANKNKVNQLVNNSTKYSGGLTPLVYPSDLITNQYGYNGCYTVLFISEHQESTIANLKDFTTSTHYAGHNQATGTTIQGIQTFDQNLKDAGNPQGIQGVMQGVVTGVGSVAVAKYFHSQLQALNSTSIAGELAGSALSLAAGAGAGFGMSKFADKFSVTKNNTAYKQLEIAIALPTPTITDVHNLEWKAHDTAVAGGLLEIANAAGVSNINFNKLFSTDAFDEINRVANLAQQKGGKLADVAVEAADAAILTATKSGIGSTLSLLSGKAANPRREMIFNNVNFRTFDMNFQLAARSKDDMENIESIIRVLKYHAYPELTKGNFMWIYPAHFDIVHYFRNNVNTHMPRHATCVLTNITIDYGGGQSFVSVHHDGSPTMINLKLTFQEIAILDREDIAKGY